MKMMYLFVQSSVKFIVTNIILRISIKMTEIFHDTYGVWKTTLAVPNGFDIFCFKKYFHGSS